MAPPAPAAPAMHMGAMQNNRGSTNPSPALAATHSWPAAGPSYGGGPALNMDFFSGGPSAAPQMVRLSTNLHFDKPKGHENVRLSIVLYSGSFALLGRIRARSLIRECSFLKHNGITESGKLTLRKGTSSTVTGRGGVCVALQPIGQQQMGANMQGQQMGAHMHKASSASALYSNPIGSIAQNPSARQAVMAGGLGDMLSAGLVDLSLAGGPAKSGSASSMGASMTSNSTRGPW